MPKSRYITIALRVAVGLVFMFSGIVKEIDPWGFYYKISEYLAAWDFTFVSRYVIQFFSAALPLVEFTCGALLLTGSLRRMVPICLLVMMCFMLPLSAYIFIANPVTDCGCFGDALVIGNGATFLKNILLTAALVWLVLKNRTVGCWITPMLQWVAVVFCCAYCLIIAQIGVLYQPVVDFRPYPVGTELLGGEAEPEVRFVYERDGERREFGMDELPDSTWTFVSRTVEETPTERTFAIFDGDEDVTADVIEPEGPQLILVVSDPAYHHRDRAGMANNLSEYIESHGGTMIGVVATSPEGLEDWKELTNPVFPVYTSEDTSLKELARGDAALVYLEDGVIKWKRNIYSLPGDFPDFETRYDDEGAEINELHEVYVVDDGRMFRNLSIALIVILCALVLASHPWSKRRPGAKTSQKSERKSEPGILQDEK